ncbi:MAG: glycosyltransferase [Acidobacteriota bacterium]|nr:glycosyltransferase [Acidobacteriota bacterium]
MKAEPRIAFFTDSYLEVNGVAHTSRQLAAFAKQRKLPFLCIHAGARTRAFDEGSLQRLMLKRTQIGFALDADLRFDLLMWRHAKLALKTVREFKPDVVHITGPSDIGLLGIYVALRLRLPIVMSWHTNIHEYAGQRLASLLTGLLPFLADVRRFSLARSAERASLKLALLFYKLGKVLLAPNEELGEMLERHLQRPVFMMRRGVDTNLFSSAKRARTDNVFTIGYVGRLTPEKNVRLLAELENGLLAAGMRDFRFVIVGTGSEREWLERNMQTAQFTGVLKGEALAQAYANLDLFIFPSHTDTFGNVVLEAQASGVPAIVSDQGGPKFILQDGISGIVAKDEQGFLDATLQLMRHPGICRQMREAARVQACRASWNNVFEQVYQAYEVSVQRATADRAIRKPLLPATMSSDAVN